MNEDLFAGLPDVLFAVKDASEVEREIVRAYEAASGRTLARGDPVRLFLLTIAAVIIQQRALIDFTGKQNLLAYSSGEYLDHLGALLGVYRLPAAPALTSLKFTLSAPQPGAVIIPGGTRVTPGGGEIYFATSGPVTVDPGNTEATAAAMCLTAGAAGNGFLPGQVGRLVDPLPWVKSVENTTETAGGADTEDDESLRGRIQIAPEKFSVAGPSGAYEYWARTAHQDIVDVAVTSPVPGEVHIYPLLKGGGIPPQGILDAVFDACNAEDVRPLTDLLTIMEPVPVEYNVSIEWWLPAGRAAEAASITSDVDRAVNGWVDWQRSALGRDVNPSELIARVVRAGAKRVEVTSPSFTVIEPHEVAVADVVDVVFGGMEDE